MFRFPFDNCTADYGLSDACLVEEDDHENILSRRVFPRAKRTNLLRVKTSFNRHHAPTWILSLCSRRSFMLPFFVDTENSPRSCPMPCCRNLIPVREFDRDIALRQVFVVSFTPIIECDPTSTGHRIHLETDSSVKLGIVELEYAAG